MVCMAQTFSLRVPLIQGQGNLGSMDGDPLRHIVTLKHVCPNQPMRWWEDLDKETVDFKPNYDETLKEPTVMPTCFPNLLVNGQRYRRGYGKPASLLIILVR